MSTNFDQPTDASPASIYDERPRTEDPAELAAQRTADRMERMERSLLHYYEEMVKARREVRELRRQVDEMRDQHAFDEPLREFGASTDPGVIAQGDSDR